MGGYGGGGTVVKGREGVVLVGGERGDGGRGEGRSRWPMYHLSQASNSSPISHSHWKLKSIRRLFIFSCKITIHPRAHKNVN